MVTNGSGPDPLLFELVEGHRNVLHYQLAPILPLLVGKVFPPTHLGGDALDDVVQRFGFAHRRHRGLTQNDLRPEPHSVANLGVFVKRSLGQHDVAFERGLAHI